MGLLYVFPVSKDEKDFIEESENQIIFKTYGLPYLFWGYALAIILVIFFMFLAIKAPVLKLIQLGDETDALLGYALLSVLGCLPLALMAFFFFEKRIIKRPGQLHLEYRIFKLPIFKEKFSVPKSSAFSVEPFLDSPNLARMKSKEEDLGFQNKGYFILWLKTEDGKKINVDRHSRKSDLIKLQSMLED